MDKRYNKNNFNSRIKRFSRKQTKITKVDNWLVDFENCNLVVATPTNDATTSFLIYFDMYTSDSRTMYTIAINCMGKKTTH